MLKYCKLCEIYTFFLNKLCWNKSIVISRKEQLPMNHDADCVVTAKRRKSRVHAWHWIMKERKYTGWIKTNIFLFCSMRYCVSVRTLELNTFKIIYLFMNFSAYYEFVFYFILFILFFLNTSSIYFFNIWAHRL